MEAAFFDLDKTIVARSSGLMFGKNFYREGLISKRVLLRGLAAQIVFLLVGADENKMDQLRQQALSLIKGWEKARVQSIIEEVMGEVITPVIYKEALDLIESHRAAGRKVFIVSSSPEEILIPLSKLLDVDDVIGTRGKVDERGRYTGELEFYCYGPQKAEAIRGIAAREGIDLQASFAYSDSITDLPMLETVGHAFAVNPDRDLNRVAADKGWEVLRFENPVTIRKKLAEFAPSPKATMLGGGVVMTVGAGFAAYLWLRRRAPEARRLASVEGGRAPAGLV
jgi:HAD superfamily hydrolase (TIGR01490 family)